MTWKENLRPASFRGIPFRIQSSSYTTGRRVVLHEFPNRDKPFPEDMGKISDNHRLEAYILGDDYFEIKKRLVDAIRVFGVGELVHPYYGTLQVQVGALSINEDTKEGRIAAVSFQFYEIGSSDFPDNSQDKEAVLMDRSSSLVARTKQQFDEKFSVDKLPSFAVDSARDKIKNISALFDESTKGIVTGSEELSKLAFANRNLVSAVDELLNKPGDLSNTIINSFLLLERSIPDFNQLASSISIFGNFGRNDSPIISSTPSRVREQENNDAINTLIRQVVIAKETEYAIENDFESVTEANEKREEISAKIEEQLLSTDNDDVYQDLMALNAVLVNSVPDIDNDLPNIENVILKKNTNSLVLVYDLFENFESEQDLISRNKIQNPAYIDAGKELEVIDVRRG